MPLILRTRQLEEVRRHAVRERPHECCGMLLGRADGDRRSVEEAVPAENVAEGDRRRRYAVDPRALLDAHRRTRETGCSVIGYYHSHPADAAVPSIEDAAHAWPHVSYLIVGSEGAGGWQARCWRWSEEWGFVEEAIEIIDEAGKELRES